MNKEETAIDWEAQKKEWEKRDKKMLEEMRDILEPCPEDSNLVAYAKNEMRVLGGTDDVMQMLMYKQTIELLTLFSDHGHSGFSAPYAIRMFTTLANWLPLKPLTGEDDEWGEPHDENECQQNRRCSKVFRYNFDNSTARMIEGKVFSDDGGKSWFSNKNSSIPVTFPFTPPGEPERIIIGEGV